MCNVGAIGLGIQGIGVLGNYIASKKEQTAYAEYQTLQTQATLTNYIQQVKSINNRYAEEQQATALEKQEIHIQNMKAKATAQASAASIGIEGITIDNLFKGYDRDSAVSDYVAAKNLEMKGLQYTDELEGMRVKAINAINLQQQYTGNPASTLIGGVGSLFTSYANYQSAKLRDDYYRGQKSTKGVS